MNLIDGSASFPARTKRGHFLMSRRILVSHIFQHAGYGPSLVVVMMTRGFFPSRFHSHPSPKSWPHPSRRGSTRTIHCPQCSILYPLSETSCLPCLRISFLLLTPLFVLTTEHSELLSHLRTLQQQQEWTKDQTSEQSYDPP